MDYIIFEFQGRQFQAKLGQEIIVDRLRQKVGEEIIVDKILAAMNGENVLIGTPYLEDVTVTLKVLEHLKGKKIRVAKYKAKSRYRKVKGFRAKLTRLLIEDIKVSEKKIKRVEKPRKMEEKNLVKRKKISRVKKLAR